MNKKLKQYSLARYSLWLALLLLTVMVMSVAAQDDTGNIIWSDPVDAEPEVGQSTDDSIVDIIVGRDTYIDSASPSSIYGYTSEIQFGYNWVGNVLSAKRPLLYFDIRPGVNGIPSNAVITRAELHVYLKSVTDANPNRKYNAQYLSTPWTEGSTSWNNAPSYGADIARELTAANYPGWKIHEVTTLARTWYNNPNGNHGFIFIGDERPELPYGGHLRTYHSKEYASGAYAPKLRVWYTTNVDDKAPIAYITTPKDGIWVGPSFTVSWDGYDPNNSNGSIGSGIKWYDVFYSLNQGTNWTAGRAQVTSKSTTADAWSVPLGQRIDLYVRAQDNAGNEGPPPSGSGSSQGWAKIDNQAPVVVMTKPDGQTTSTTIDVAWNNTNNEAAQSGIREYQLQWRKDDGVWNTVNRTTPSWSLSGATGGSTYDFQVRGVDNVGNIGEWSAIKSTTVWLEPVAVITGFNPANIYQKIDPPADGDKFQVQWAGFTPAGTSIVSFDVQFQRPGNPTWLAWGAATGTSATFADFVLTASDPDGIYTFQARAKNSAGVQGTYHEEYQGKIIVDRNAPYVGDHMIYMSFIAK